MIMNVEGCKRLAVIVVASAVNDYASWLAQQSLFPQGIKDIRAYAKESGRKLEPMCNYYLRAQQEGEFAYNFLRSPYAQVWTSYNAEELLSFARRKSETLKEHYLLGKHIVLRSWIEWEYTAYDEE